MLRTNSSLEALVDTDLDTLATALYVTVDDLLLRRPIESMTYSFGSRRMHCPERRRSRREPEPKEDQ